MTRGFALASRRSAWENTSGSHLGQVRPAPPIRYKRKGLQPMLNPTTDTREVARETPTCPPCGLQPVTEHRWAKGTLHTDTYTCPAGHIYQVRWTEAA